MPDPRLFGLRRINFVEHVGNPIVEELCRRSQRLAKKTGAPPIAGTPLQDNSGGFNACRLFAGSSATQYSQKRTGITPLSCPDSMSSKNGMEARNIRPSRSV
jgi:hypothetical protein